LTHVKGDALMDALRRSRRGRSIGFRPAAFLMDQAGSIMFEMKWMVGAVLVAACAQVNSADAQEPVTRATAESTASVPAAALFALVEAPNWRAPTLPANATIDLRQKHVYLRDEWQLTAEFVWQEATNGFDWHLVGYTFDRLPESVAIQEESK
jgi:hypothetical protein